MAVKQWIVFAVLLLCGCSSKAPPGGRPATRILPLQEIAEYSEATAPEIYLRTPRDVLPGGLAAAMVPVLVDWDQSNPTEPGGDYILRNLNDGGNPLGGTTVLRSARIPADAIERAEFILVPLGGMGMVAHGMLRFVFSDERRGRLLGPQGDELGLGSELGDLILSWEAWRPPGVDFDFVRGMDPDTFGLTLRAFSGPQRFLEDVLGDRKWKVYELRLPGGQRGLQELLHSSLILGDGTGRQVLAKIFSRDSDEWLSQGPGAEQDPLLARQRWSDLMEAVRDFEEPQDSRLRLEEKDRNYQTLLRSCSTMALYCINVATERLLRQGIGQGQGIHPTSAAMMPAVASWMAEMAHMTALETFLVAPEVIAYLIDHTTVIPKNVPGALEEAGLLAPDSKVLEYSLDGVTPYGDLGGILIR